MSSAQTQNLTWTQESLEALIREILSQELKLEFSKNLPNTSDFWENGISSMEVIRLLSHLEIRLDILVDDDQYQNCRSIQKVAAVCFELIESHPGVLP